MPVQENVIHKSEDTVREDFVRVQQDPRILAPVDSDYPQGTPNPDIHDRQHLDIKRRQQYLRTAIVIGEGMDQIIAYSKDLIRTTLYHFESEEDAMTTNKFQDLATHRLFHAEMIERLKEMSDDMECRRISRAMELIRFFDGRLTYHMDVEDAAWERELKKLDVISSPVSS
jgi:hemerythrin-like metal-binding protein